MVYTRRALSSWTPLVRQRPTTATRSSLGRQTWRQVKARGYASGHGHAPSKGGDMVWGLSAVAVTVPALYWIGLYKPGEGGHGHDHEEEHAEGGEEDEQQDGGEEEESKSEDAEKSDAGKEGEDSEDAKDSEDKTDSDSEGDDDKQDTPDTSDDEGGDEDKKPAKPTKGSPQVQEGEEGDKNTTVKYADAKGGFKNRKESKKAIKQGEPDEDADTSGDKAHTAKTPAGGVASVPQSGKQEGISNTDTKHSYNLNDSPDHSKKPEGGPDTAKAKGTVSAGRPQV